MVCLQFPSPVFMVICGWLQCFIAAKGKMETIRKKFKKKREENIWRKMLVHLHFHTNVAVNFQYLQSQA